MTPQDTEAICIVVNSLFDIDAAGYKIELPFGSLNNWKQKAAALISSELDRMRLETVEACAKILEDDIATLKTIATRDGATEKRKSEALYARVQLASARKAILYSILEKEK